MKSRLLLSRLTLGAAALLAWLVLFAAGLLIETGKYRRFLAPETYADEVRAAEEAGEPLSVYGGNAASAFCATTVCYTPTNLIFLTLLAGLLGGCSSNVVAGSASREDVPQDQRRRQMYLEENPWSAMIRGFLVYLCVIAGLYFVMDDPFKNPTPSQYLRLAGTLSVLAFVVGYDPSRIEQWIHLVPNPQATQVVTVRDAEAGVELTAAQGPMASEVTGLDHISELQPSTAMHSAFSSDGADGPPKQRKSPSIR